MYQLLCILHGSKSKLWAFWDHLEEGYYAVWVHRHKAWLNNFTWILLCLILNFVATIAVLGFTQWDAPPHTILNLILNETMQGPHTIIYTWKTLRIFRWHLQYNEKRDQNSIRNFTVSNIYPQHYSLGGHFTACHTSIKFQQWFSNTMRGSLYSDHTVKVIRWIWLQDPFWGAFYFIEISIVSITKPIQLWVHKYSLTCMWHEPTCPASSFLGPAPPATWWESLHLQDQSRG